MKGIRSLKDELNRERKRKRIGGIVIIALLIFSTLGFALSIVSFDGGNIDEEEKQGFSHNGRYWVYNSGLQKYYFTHHIDEINYSFSLSKNLIDFSNKQIYIDSRIIGGLEEIYTDLGYYSKINEACYGQCERDLPEKSCSDEETLIVTRESETEEIREVENCIFIEGDIKTVDAFLYKVLGIN